MANDKRVVRTGTFAFDNADRLAGGKLTATLRRHRGAGLSYASIASELFAEFGIKVSPPTVGSWLRDLGLLESEAASA